MVISIQKKPEEQSPGCVRLRHGPTSAVTNERGRLTLPPDLPQRVLWLHPQSKSALAYHRFCCHSAIRNRNPFHFHPNSPSLSLREGAAIRNRNHPHFENPQPRQKAQPSPNSRSPPQSGHSGQRPRLFLFPPFAQSDDE
jgi:hypothetical protein